MTNEEIIMNKEVINEYLEDNLDREIERLRTI